MKIRATTKVYGIFGHPVEHSLSPHMHNSAFEALGLDCVYVAFEVKPGDVDISVRALRTLGIKGVNVTIPHKEAVVSCVDDLHPDALLVGAVNTIKNVHGMLSGYNTDVGGFLRALKEDFGIVPTGKTAMLIGAGGAARAVIVALCNEMLKELIIVNRTISKAESLAREFSKHFPSVKFKVFALDDEVGIAKEIRRVELLVNSTSAGMKGLNPLNLPLGLMPKGASVYDLVYDPLVTPLVKDARAVGLQAQSGISMLLYQGVEAFEIWTGHRAPVDVMRKALTVKRFLDETE